MVAPKFTRAAPRSTGPDLAGLYLSPERGYPAARGLHVVERPGMNDIMHAARWVTR